MKIREGETIPSTEFFYIDDSGVVKKIKNKKFDVTRL